MKNTVFLFILLGYNLCVANLSNNDTIILSGKYRCDIDSIQFMYNINKDTNYKVSKHMKIFFNVFPNNFDCFIDTYGYIDYSTDSTFFAPLYDIALEHINAFFRTKNFVPSDEFIRKVISISIDGFWEADAVSYFKQNLFISLEENILLYNDILTEYFSYDEIKSFWLFYFDEPHPENYNLYKLDEFKNVNKQMYELIQKCFLESIQKNKHECSF